MIILATHSHDFAENVEIITANYNCFHQEVQTAN